MLVLSRKIGDSVVIGDNIRLTVVKVQGSSTVRLAVDAPPEVRILRAELLQALGVHDDWRSEAARS